MPSPSPPREPRAEAKEERDGRQRSRSPRRSRSPAPRKAKSYSGLKWKNDKKDSSDRDSRRRDDRDDRRRDDRRDDRRSDRDRRDDRYSGRDERRGGDRDRRDDRRDDRGSYRRRSRSRDRRPREDGPRRPRDDKTPKTSARAPVASTGEAMILVTVNDRLGTKTQVPCLPSDPVKVLKAMVAAKIGRPVHEIMLKRQGERPFHDSLSLADYAISNGVQIDLELNTGD
ncbi:hypothetical protein E8E12_004667 [Didymella heteroderae]|uniref:Ubiquitin-like modifier HUB1 n=1 Tax=Didymella heteroderae TaxID=1769908 RepID=A0A9P4WI31_9PLEO|nr:hypothetical protein E8E12_004667 [Didymella heteroderae]